MGCAETSTVRLTSLPTEPYRVELLVLLPGAQQPFDAHECDGGSSCRQEIFFTPLTPLTLSHLSVRVTTVAGSVVTEVPNVDYVKTFPNGRSCGPTCLNATVTADVPV